MQEMDDIGLLQAFVTEGSEEAFATLVKRYAGLVYSTALRRVDYPHQAEEVAQVVFILLARKAQRLNKVRVLSSWLFQVTRLTAANFMRREIRRARREQVAQAEAGLQESATDPWNQVAPLLDSAVASLKETDRHAILLRFYKGLSLREVGHALGTSEDATYQRVARAVEKLRRFFARRDVVLSTSALAGLLSTHAASAAPPGLEAATTGAALAPVTLTGSAAPALEAALRSLWWAKAKPLLSFGGGLLATGVIAATLLLSRQPALTPRFQGLGDLPGGDYVSYASAVSGDGTVVVGMSKSARGNEAFRWTDKTGMVGLGDLPGGAFASDASAVSADGRVVVGTSVSSSGTEAFRWTEATGLRGLGDLPGGRFYSAAHAVSGDGRVIAGESSSGRAEREAFRWTESEGMAGLGNLPGGPTRAPVFLSLVQGVSADGSVLVGYGRQENGNEAFRWTKAAGMRGLGDLPAGVTNSAGLAVSPDGEITVGFGYSGAFDPYTQEACRWTAKSGLVGLGFAPGTQNSLAYALSADGNRIVGDNKSGVPFLWERGAGMRLLQEVLTNDFGLSLAGWKLTSARGISYDGSVIVGSAVNPRGQNEGWIVTGLGKTRPRKRL